MSGATVKTIIELQRLTHKYARLCGHTCLEVTEAVLRSKTLQNMGYEHEIQQGRLFEDQAQAACEVLMYWIERTKKRNDQNGKNPRAPR